MYKEMLSNSYLFGANAPFIEQLYEAFLRDPAAVEPRWRDYFEELQRLEQGPRDVAHTPIQDAFVRLAKERRGGDGHAAPLSALSEAHVGKQVAVLQLINAFRFHGARHARLDPLNRQEKPAIPELDPAFYGLT